MRRERSRVNSAPMHTRLPAALLGLLTFFFWITAQATPPAKPTARHPAIRYQLSIHNPSSQYIDLEVSVPRAKGRSTKLSMPAWTPGSYFIRDFARHVFDVRATNSKGSDLVVQRLSKQTWQVNNRGQDFTLRYRVFADDLSVRASYVDSYFGLLNGTSLFMYVEKKKKKPCELAISLPPNWRPHIALPQTSATPKPPTFAARDYDHLVDSPILVGQTINVRSFQALNTKFDYVVVAPSGTNAQIDQLADDAKRFVTTIGNWMGGKFPFENYKFLVVLDAIGGGGLEHTDSTAMILKPWIFDDPKGYERAARLGAHEFFHAWNVKRIHDHVLGPFDYHRETYTDLLWFHEGFTETMARRALLESGLIKESAFLSKIQKLWTRYLKRPGRNFTPIEQLSREAWIKAYRSADNHANTTVSYYQKGDVLGIMLDVELHQRAAAHQRQGSLVGMFERLWAQRPKNRWDYPITKADVIHAASEEAGEDMRWFFERHVSGTAELELPKTLAQIGIEVKAERPWVASATANPAEKRQAKRKQAWSGFTGSGAEIRNIVPGSPAEQAKLMIGDEIIAIEQTRTTSIPNANAQLANYPSGQSVNVTYFRRSRLETTILQVGENPYKKWTFSAPNRTSKQAQPLLDRWLFRPLNPQ